MMDLISSQLGYAISILLVLGTTIYYYIKKKISEKLLFQDPPPKEDCPICMLPMPYTEGLCGVGMVYMSCCGKYICKGCAIATREEIAKGNIKRLCPFCRMRLPKSNEESPHPSSDNEWLKRIKDRMELSDAEAFYELAEHYRDGENLVNALNSAAKLGSIRAHARFAAAYFRDLGIEENINIEKAKALHHCKLAAIGGHEIARFHLGAIECKNGNMDTAMKHYIISAKSGYDGALKVVGVGYEEGYVTKDEYASTLRAYQVSTDEMKSVEREIAALLED